MSEHHQWYNWWQEALDRVGSLERELAAARAELQARPIDDGEYTRLRKEFATANELLAIPISHVCKDIRSNAFEAAAEIAHAFTYPERLIDELTNEGRACRTWAIQIETAIKALITKQETAP